jgi:hypothetical protein
VRGGELLKEVEFHVLIPQIEARHCSVLGASCGARAAAVSDSITIASTSSSTLPRCA